MECKGGENHVHLSVPCLKIYRVQRVRVSYETKEAYISKYLVTLIWSGNLAFNYPIPTINTTSTGMGYILSMYLVSTRRS